jgi:two-component system NtrC family sensor kinase
VHEAIIHSKNNNGDRDLQIISSPILDKSGQIMAVIELIKDITDDLAMEKELQQSQKMASIGQLAAGVAHEINNPTGFVSSNLKSLQAH